MRVFTCVFLTTGLLLLVCAGCGTNSQPKKPTVSTSSQPPGTGAGGVTDGPTPLTQSTAGPGGTPATETKKEAAEAKAAEEKKSDDAKPSDEKKSEDAKSGEEKKGDEKKPE